MSYEGYYQLICENGHYWTEDCLVHRWDEDSVCPSCQGKVIWTNPVDITNGSFEGNKRVDGYESPILISEKKMRTL